MNKHTQIEVTQRCCEWMALVNMANALVSSMNEQDKIYDAMDIIAFGGALIRIEEQVPAEGVLCGTSATVVFGENHIVVLVMLVDWFDDFMLGMAPRLEAYNAEAFAHKYAQVGLVKRNLKQYAKVLQNSNDGESAA